MNDFKYNIELQEIKAATLIGFLKKKVVFHSNRADNYNTSNEHQSCHLTTDLSIKTQHFHLYKAAYDRLLELGWDTTKLPKVHQSTTAPMMVLMPLLTAHTITQLYRKDFDFTKALEEL